MKPEEPLEFDWWMYPRGDTRDAITRIGLEHHIVTAFTSLVAVDESRVIGDGNPRLVVEPQMYEASATASRDAVGLSLAGTTAAESKYSVEGVNVTSPSFGTVGNSMVEEFAEPSRSRNWQPRARVNFGRPSSPEGVRTADVRKPAQAVRRGLRTCYERSDDFNRDARYVLSVVLEWTASGVEVRLAGGRLSALRACFESVLRKADWPTLPQGTRITLPLRLSAQ